MGAGSCSSEIYTEKDVNEFNISLLRQMSRKSCHKSKLGQGTFCFAFSCAILKRFPHHHLLSPTTSDLCLLKLYFYFPLSFLVHRFLAQLMTLSTQTFVLLPGRSLEQSRPTTLYTHFHRHILCMCVCLSMALLLLFLVWP